MEHLWYANHAGKFFSISFSNPQSAFEILQLRKFEAQRGVFWNLTTAITQKAQEEKMNPCLLGPNIP
jgi:hypothetical protein